MTWRARAVAWGLACVVACVACARPSHAADEAPLDPRPGSLLRDREFGVQTRGFGLDRRVEMLQWQRVEGRYRRVWHDAVIDSAAYDPGHANPAMPVRNRRWWSDDAHIARKPIDLAVLQALGTWTTMRPGFAGMSGTVAARYQPEGDGLGSADNPLEPDIGDVRITWRELTLPPLDGRVELRRGTWQLRGVPMVAVAPSPLDPVAPPAAPPTAPAPIRDDPPPPWPWVAAVLAAAVVLVGWRAFRLKRDGRPGA